MVIGGTVAGVSAANDGAGGWELVGAIATGALVGGAIGAAVGVGVGLAATGAAAALGGGGAATTAGIMASGGAGAAALSGMSSAAVTTGLSIVSVGALAGVGVLSAGLLGQYLFSKIPMHGTPNSTVSNNGSTGFYDENGNLFARQDTIGKPHYIKRLGNHFLPHTHIYLWDMVNGVWHIIMKFVLPF